MGFAEVTLLSVWQLETSAPGAEGYPGSEVIAMLVKDCMTPDPDVVTPDVKVPEAAQIMKKGGFRRLPVVKWDVYAAYHESADWPLE